MNARTGIGNFISLNFRNVSGYCCPTVTFRNSARSPGYGIFCVVYCSYKESARRNCIANYNINIVSRNDGGANDFVQRIVITYILSAPSRCHHRPRLRRRRRCRRRRIAYTSHCVEILGPGSRVKFANGIYIFRQPARSMTHLRDTERRHLPQPFDKLDNNNYRANPCALTPSLPSSDLLFQETRESQFIARAKLTSRTTFIRIQDCSSRSRLPRSSARKDAN